MTVLVESRDRTRELTFSEAFACVYCGLSFEELAPRLFSFNSPYGACPVVQRLGEKIEIDPWKVIPDRSKSMRDGAIVPWSQVLGTGRFPSMNPYYLQQLERVLRSYRVKMTTPIENMPDEVVDVILYGTEQEQTFAYTSRARQDVGVSGVVRRRRQQPAAPVQRNLQRLRQRRHREIHVGLDLPACKGARLKPEALAVTIGGANIDALTQMSIEKLGGLFRRLRTDAAPGTDRAPDRQGEFARGSDF